VSSSRHLSLPKAAMVSHVLAMLAPLSTETRFVLGRKLAVVCLRHVFLTDCATTKEILLVLSSVDLVL
jgi:hypothetical protein